MELKNKPTYFKLPVVTTSEIKESILPDFKQCRFLQVGLTAFKVST